ncbi:MAG: hypothetical protein E7066_09785 [Lentimicrobiaceae bacterium]|nr:hypothetical protein [Lentimicrobiaceae bacterium]
MASVLASKSILCRPLGSESVNSNILNGNDYAFLPIPYFIYVLESAKKNRELQISQIKSALTQCVDQYSVIELSPKALSNALSNSDFCSKYVNSQSNPFKFATEASLYDDSFWGDIVELQEELDVIIW